MGCREANGGKQCAVKKQIEGSCLGSKGWEAMVRGISKLYSSVRLVGGKQANSLILFVTLNLKIIINFKPVISDTLKYNQQDAVKV